MTSKLTGRESLPAPRREKLAAIVLRSHRHEIGESAPKTGKWEIIGPDACPILARRTLLGGRLGKLLFHEFFPNASDADCHDHPRSFLTIVCVVATTTSSRTAP